MNKTNQFRSADFYMATGDVLHMIIKDETGTTLDLVLMGGDGLEAAPGQVVAIDATDITASGFTANWLFTENADGYIFNLATDPDMTPHVAGYENLDVGNVSSLVITGLDPNYTYYYTLNAYNNIGEGLVSNIITVTLTFVNVNEDYGILYNWFIIDSDKLAPIGWHVPTDEDFNTLATFIEAAATPFSNSVGGKLKETGTTHWTSDHTIGANAYGFSFRGAGIRSSDGTSNDGVFALLKDDGYLWSSDQTADTFGHMMFIPAGDTTMYYYYGGTGIFRYMNLGLSIRLIKDDSTDPGTFTDYDGNVYNTVKIGSQVWMASNLKVTHFNDGSPMIYLRDSDLWITNTEGAYCWYNNTGAPVLGTSYIIYTDGTSIFRKGVRSHSFVIDKALTTLGFNGVEDTDWTNIKTVTP